MQFFFFSSSFLALVALVSAQGFIDTCNSVDVVGEFSSTSLQANCDPISGSAISTSIPLSSCITNTNGKMECQRGGNAMESCGGCTILGSELTCRCNDGSASLPTTIDLNQCISNNNGNLGC